MIHCGLAENEGCFREVMRVYLKALAVYSGATAEHLQIYSCPKSKLVLVSYIRPGRNAFGNDLGEVVSLIRHLDPFAADLQGQPPP